MCDILVLVISPFPQHNDGHGQHHRIDGEQERPYGSAILLRVQQIVQRKKVNFKLLSLTQSRRIKLLLKIAFTHASGKLALLNRS